MNLKEKVNWQKFQDFQNENKDMLIMCASPKDDGISISFGGLNTFVKFPFESLDKGVVFNALRKSKFTTAIDTFIGGVVQSSGIDSKDKESNELLKVVGGAIKSIGEARDKQGRELRDNYFKDDVKNNKKRVSKSRK